METTFKDLGINDNLLRKVGTLGYKTPTAIQIESIPHIIAGKDVIGESATGSGKTFAFGCGIVQKAVHGKGIQAMVLTPTRELAQQVTTELKKLSGLTCIAVYGGVSIDPQVSQLKQADVVIATPGRLLDHLSRRTINLSNLKIIVLDEADRMLDMGFIDDVEKILRSVPATRQTLFFSATIRPEISALAGKHMKDPVKVRVNNQVDPSKLKQIYYDVPRGLKMSLLVHLLTHESSGLVMVFCNTRSSVDYVVRNLSLNKVNAIAIHGGLTQNKRAKTIDSFHKGKVAVLVCTDVAARGLHISNVSHVYNYDIPNDPTDYVHRIGRTARAGESGKVINLISERDFDGFSRLLSDYKDFKIQQEKRPFIQRKKQADEGRRTKQHSTHRQDRREPDLNILD